MSYFCLQRGGANQVLLVKQSTREIYNRHGVHVICYVCSNTLMLFYSI